MLFALLIVKCLLQLKGSANWHTAKAKKAQEQLTLATAEVEGAELAQENFRQHLAEVTELLEPIHKAWRHANAMRIVVNKQ